jgi:predicted AlkP superfamily phosphohydrolase/phosphomutase
MTARHLVVGLDGADVEVIERLGRERLPTLFALRAERGAWARLRSVMPCATLPNWTTFLTGVDPGTHGVFDFTTRTGARVAFTGGTVRAVPTIGARLDRLGLACAIVGFPATFPPEPLAQGVFVSGWDSPVDFEADARYVHPPELHRALTARFGPLRFDEVDEFIADRPGWHASLGARLEARVDARTELASHLLASRSWDLFAFYFGESDTASHHLHALWDETSPRHPRDVTEDEREGLPRVYAALDRALARLLREAGTDVELTVVSDHGSGPSSDKVLYLNRALAEKGMLSFRDSRASLGASGGIVSRARSLAMQAVPPRAKHALFHAFGRALPGMLESRTRFSAIDFSRTRVFSDELNYFPALHYNLRGREPEGIVKDHELPALSRKLEAWAGTLRDPRSDQRIVREVTPRDELYVGPFVERAPDYVLELNRDRGYAYNVMPASGPGPCVELLPPRDHLGRKGRSLPGAHKPRGLYIAHGPSVRAQGEIDARMVDATATLLHRMGIEPDPAMPGRVLREALVDALRPTRTLPPAELFAAKGAGDLALTEERLRALGYVE